MQHIKAALVTFADDEHPDDAVSILTALRMVRGVRDVAAVPADVDDYVARVRLAHAFQDKLNALMDDVREGR